MRYNNLLGYYKNGNYWVSIFSDGTKIRSNNLDHFDADTVESLDIKITNKCDRNCKFCHEGSSNFGKHADILSASFLDKLHPYTELAIGGGNPLSHPDLYKFLLKCKERGHLSNITVNQVHFEKEFDRIYKYAVEDGLLFGVGVSLVNATPKLIELLKKIPNSVVHVINGIVTKEQLDVLRGNNLKILILGYKEVRRGKKLYNENGNRIDNYKRMMRELLPIMVSEKWFKVISFDNLAIKQLQVRGLMTEDEWKKFYMGDDGQDGQQSSATFFVDMIEKKFAKNSCSMERFDLLDTAEKMFNRLKNQN